MKKLIALSFILVLPFLISSCGSDDGGQPAPEVPDSFEISGTTYNTPFAVLKMDYVSSSMSDGFILVLQDAEMRIDNVNGSSIQTSMNHGVGLHIFFSQSSVSSEQAIVSKVVNGTSYPLGEETGATTSVSGWTNTYTYGGYTWGLPVITGANSLYIGTTGSGSATINSFTIDLSARIGTINCDYSFTDPNGIQVAGHYSGNFSIINGI